MKPQLNDQQQEAFDLLMAFVKKPGSEMFCLKGYAGTGKTFVISRFIEAIEKKHPYWKVAMTAPTNKAVQVLRESATVSNKVVFKTIHSMLGLQEVIKDSGEIDFEKDWQEDPRGFRQYKIVIIDEVSMLADKLFFEVKRYNSEVKIIMMGDPAQIPPVGKVDCEPFLNPEKHDIKGYQLTKIMRQADGSAIIDNSFYVRDNLNSDGFTFSAGSDVRVYTAGAQRREIGEFFDRVFKLPGAAVDSRVIAWTNRKVAEYNGYIRVVLYGPQVERFVIGERLVMNKPYPVLKILTPLGSVWELATTNQEVEILKMRVDTDKLETDERFTIYVIDIIYHKDGQKKEGVLKVMHESSVKAFQKVLADIKNEAITGPTDQRRGTWKRYYQVLRTVADVSYAYAITAHKSQGSTYKTAVVDARNIEMNSNIVERNRILYTAITRAKTELLIIK